MNTNFVSVTEIAGDDVSREQVDRICNRYYWAGTYCVAKKVVEAACGTGQGIGYLASISESFEAGDYSEAILSITRDHYRQRVSVRQFDAQNMPFEDDSLDVVLLFEAIYYLPEALQFIRECSRVLKPGGKVLVSTANKDLYDFNPSPHSYKYYGVVELEVLFSSCGFSSEFFGDGAIGETSFRQRVLRPIKKLVVGLDLMPKTMSGKKLLKRLVFGELVKMPKEIGAPLDPYQESTSALIEGNNDQSEDHMQDNEQSSVFYRGVYREPETIPSGQANKTHKVILCVATLIK